MPKGTGVSSATSAEIQDLQVWQNHVVSAHAYAVELGVENVKFPIGL
jgi:hypothetical protein